MPADQSRTRAEHLAKTAQELDDLHRSLSVAQIVAVLDLVEAADMVVVERPAGAREVTDYMVNVAVREFAKGWTGSNASECMRRALSAALATEVPRG